MKRSATVFEMMFQHKKCAPKQSVNDVHSIKRNNWIQKNESNLNRSCHIASIEHYTNKFNTGEV